MKRARQENVNTHDYWDRKLEGIGRRWRHYSYKPLDLSKFGPGDVVIDVGCALGDGLKYLQSKWPACKYVGVDHSEYAIGVCDGRHTDMEFHCADVVGDMKLPVVADLVLCVQTLEHLEKEPMKLIHMFREHARKSVIITVPRGRNRDGAEHVWHFTGNDFTNADSVGGDKGTIIAEYSGLAV